MRKLFPLIVLFFSLSAAPTFAQKLNAKIAKQHQVQRVVVLPAKVSIVKVGIKGTEPMEKETAEAKPLFEKTVTKVLQEKKFAVLDGDFKIETLESNEKMKYALADLQTSFDELNEKIMKKNKDIEKGRFSLGDKVLLVNQDDQADAFVFIRAVGQQSTKGKKAFALLTLDPFSTIMSFPMCSIQMTMVDARSGEVLAQTTAFTMGDVIKNTDKALSKPLTNSLKKLASPASAK
ncbi:MAG TPA: hypothetical protein VFZ34_07885 [Blastocatellia bacterium]|nr:hypothetical protein [Blastocatellia bacterium]